jgi:hypothetical protein
MTTDRGASVERDGYAVLGSLLDEPGIEFIRDCIAEDLGRSRGQSCERPHNTLIPLRWDDRSVNGVLASGAQVGRIADAVGARDLRWISGYLSAKEAASPALWWHQDWWCWDHPVSFAAPAPQVAVLCYLTDTDERTAALRVLPGSHRASTPLHRALPEAHAAPAGGLDPSHPALADHPAQVTLSLRAGDAVALDYRLLHGTHANASSRRRDCLLLTFAPRWLDLPDEIRAHLIRHPALPGPGEVAAPSWGAALLPRYEGVARDLPLNRTPPAAFAAEPEVRSRASAPGARS